MKVRGQTAINGAASGLRREAFSADLRLQGNGLQQRGVAPASPCDAPAPLPDPSPPPLTVESEGLIPYQTAH